MGRPLNLNPPELLSHALAAHHRGDDRALRTLLRRIILKAPTSDEAMVARTLLTALPPLEDGLPPTP